MFTSNTKENTEQMLKEIGVSSLADLFKDISPDLFAKGYNLPPALDEAQLSKHIKSLANKNKPLLNFAGGGFYEHFIPAAVNAISSRGEFLTAYTPYQAEVSQGTLQAIYEYQSCICALFDMDVSNASHYDGATALAEACAAAVKIKGNKKVLLSGGINPQYKEVLETYFESGSVVFEEVPLKEGRVDKEILKQKLSQGASAFALSSPNFFGVVEDAKEIGEIVKGAGALFIMNVNPLSLGALATPGACGADFAVAEGQPLGNALNFGGPTLGIFTCKKDYVRYIPGRLCGIAKDADGKRAFVLTLQAREQHIRREKASSNICSNQALCALNAAIYLTVNGPRGIKEIAELNIERAHQLKDAICSVAGYKLKYDAHFFNEFVIECPKAAKQIIKAMAKKGITAGCDLGGVSKDLKNCLLVCATETKTPQDIKTYVQALGGI